MGKAPTYREEDVYPEAKGKIEMYTMIKEKISACQGTVRNISSLPQSATASQFEDAILQGDYYDQYAEKVAKWVQEYAKMCENLKIACDPEIASGLRETEAQIQRWTELSHVKRQVPV